jgi:tetratricopeptide (TPR) repeat protein
VVEVSYLLDQQLTEAIERTQELTERYPDDPEAWYLLGDAYYHIGYRVGISKRDRLAPFERAIALDSSYLPAVLHPLEYSLELDELERFDRYARLYLAYDSTSQHALALALTRDLVRGSAEDSLAALDALTDQEWDVLRRAVIMLWGGPRQAPLAARVASELAAPRFPVADRFRGLDSNVAPIAIWRGRLAAARQANHDAEQLMPTAPDVEYNWILWYISGFGDEERASLSLERLVRQDASALQYPPFRAALGWYYMLSGDPDGFAAQLDTCDFLAARLRAAGNSLGADLAESTSRALNGLLASQRGDHVEAAAAFRQAAELLDGSAGATPHAFYRFALATSLLEAGEEAEALDILGTLDGAGGLDARAAFARAQLYEQRGERQQAIRSYARVVELWKDCDPELRPTWEAAQKRRDLCAREAPGFPGAKLVSDEGRCHGRARRTRAVKRRGPRRRPEPINLSSATC